MGRLPHGVVRIFLNHVDGRKKFQGSGPFFMLRDHVSPGRLGLLALWPKPGEKAQSPRHGPGAWKWRPVNISLAVSLHTESPGTPQVLPQPPATGESQPHSPGVASFPLPARRNKEGMATRLFWRNRIRLLGASRTSFGGFKILWESGLSWLVGFRSEAGVTRIQDAPKKLQNQRSLPCCKQWPVSDDMKTNRPASRHQRSK